MRNLHRGLVAALAVAVGLAGAAGAQEGEPGYTIHTGVITGLPGHETAVTILLDPASGKTWMLGVLDERTLWLPLPWPLADFDAPP